MAKTYVKVVDFTDKIDKLLDKRPKSGSKKDWQKEWDALMREAFNEEPKTESTGKKGKEKAK